MINIDYAMQKCFKNYIARNKLISSGIESIDRVIHSFDCGNLYVFAGCAGMGKKELIKSMAYNMCKEDTSVGFLSFKKPIESVALSFLSYETYIPENKISSKRITSDDYINITQVAGEISEFKMFVSDNSNRDIDDIVENLRQQIEENSIEIIFIDSLQCIESSKYSDRHSQISHISRELKRIALSLHIPIVVTYDISLRGDSRSDCRPKESDLCNSGNIIDYADFLGFLYRESFYNIDAENLSLTELFICKSSICRGAVYLEYLSDCSMFLSSDYKPD